MELWSYSMSFRVFPNVGHHICISVLADLILSIIDAYFTALINILKAMVRHPRSATNELL